MSEMVGSGERFYSKRMTVTVLKKSGMHTEDTDRLIMDRRWR